MVYFVFVYGLLVVVCNMVLNSIYMFVVCVCDEVGNLLVWSVVISLWMLDVFDCVVLLVLSGFKDGGSLFWNVLNDNVDMMMEFEYMFYVDGHELVFVGYDIWFVTFDVVLCILMLLIGMYSYFVRVMDCLGN